MYRDETLSASIDPFARRTMSSSSTSKHQHRTELRIPIRQDPRSFEQRERDHLHALQRCIECDDWAARSEEDWFRDIRQDMEHRREAWEQEMGRMREEFFQLRPTSMLGGTGSSFTSQTSTSTTSSSSGRPNSSTTTTTTTTKSSKSDCGNDSRSMLVHGAGASTGANLENMNVSYERGEDGQVRMKLIFDVKEFKPEDVRVVTKDRQLTVTAKYHEHSASSCSSREFSRSIDLPATVDAEALQCNLTKDGVLTLEAPIQSPAYPALRSAPAPASSSITPVLVQSGAVETSGKTGTSVRTVDGQRRLQLEVNIGADYRPEEITVKAEQRKICIAARHEEKTANQSSFREFSKEFEMPESVNPALVMAKLQDGVLLVEAPL